MTPIPENVRIGEHLGAVLHLSAMMFKRLGWFALASSMACGACVQQDGSHEPIDEAARQQAHAVADGFWRAAVAKDWDAMCAFAPAGESGDEYCAKIIDAFEHRGQPVELLEIGEPFRRGRYPGVFVPYRVRFDDGKHSWTKDFRLAVRDDNPEHRFVIDGGI